MKTIPVALSTIAFKDSVVGVANSNVHRFLGFVYGVHVSYIKILK